MIGNAKTPEDTNSLCKYGETLSQEEIDCLLSSIGDEYKRRSKIMDLNLISKAQCGSKEKNGMIKLIAEIIALSNVSRRRGLLALDEVVNKLSCDSLKAGIQMVVDGIDPDMIEDTLLKMVYTENYEGAELFKRLIIIEGVRSIQFGENSFIIKIRLFSMFGEKMLSEILKDSSKIDSQLDKCNPFKPVRSGISEIIKNTSESGTFNLIKYAFGKILKSSIVLKHLTSTFLFKDNKEVLSNNVKVWSGAISDFIDEVLEPEVSGYRVKNLSVSQLKELASLIQASYFYDKDIIALEVSKALSGNEDFHTDYRNMKIDDYEAEIRGRIREFFKVILSLITQKRKFLQLNDSFLRDIINFTIVEGKAAVYFIKDNNILIAFGMLEKEVFSLTELPDYKLKVSYKAGETEEEKK